MRVTPWDPPVWRIDSSAQVGSFGNVDQIPDILVPMATRLKSKNSTILLCVSTASLILAYRIYSVWAFKASWNGDIAAKQCKTLIDRLGHGRAKKTNSAVELLVTRK